MGIKPTIATINPMARPLLVLVCLAVALSLAPDMSALAGPPLKRCSLATQQSGQELMPRPECGIELTCAGQPVQLGYSEGVCFRATCPGVWAVLHKRADQNSFRRRIWTYRHYSFNGYWRLKDQGALESGPIELRALFLVMPDDLIEFRLQEADRYAQVELRNLGYIKRGDICELKKWLAKQSYMSGPALVRLERRQAKRDSRTPGKEPPCYSGWFWRPMELARDFFSGLPLMGKRLGSPF